MVALVALVALVASVSSVALVALVISAADFTKKYFASTQDGGLERRKRMQEKRKH